MAHTRARWRYTHGNRQKEGKEGMQIYGGWHRASVEGLRYQSQFFVAMMVSPQARSLPIIGKQRLATNYGQHDRPPHCLHVN